jgi:rhamnosyltransferase subunit B
VATILYAWELGAGFGHLIPLSRIEQKLRQDGHRAVFAVADVAAAAAALGPQAVIVQAPVWPAHRHFGAAGGSLASYTDILAAIGLADSGKLAAVMRAWLNLIDLVRPDAVVVDHSPGLLAALHGSAIPVVAVGSGFTMPPVDRDAFPPLRADNAPAIPEGRLLQALRSAQTLCGRPPSAGLTQAFRTAGRIVFGVPELDPYRSFRREELAAPPGGLPTALPPPPEHRLFVYVGEDADNFAALAQALSMLDAPLEAYLRGGSGPFAEFLRLRGATVHEALPPLDEVLARVSHVLTQGGAMTSAAAFTAGRPQLVVPTHDEAELNLALLQQFGVARRLATRGNTAQAIAADIGSFLADTVVADAAGEIAERLATRRLEDGAVVAADAVRRVLN